MMVLSGIESKAHYITAEGLEELKRLLAELKQDRTKIAAEVRSLAAQSISVLDDPLQSQSYRRAEEISEQIARLERILGSAKLITRPAVRDRVQLGSRVVLTIGGVRHSYSIVGSLEADPINGKISNESPLGLQLIGKRVKERFDIVIRERRVAATVTRIS